MVYKRPAGGGWRLLLVARLMAECQEAKRKDQRGVVHGYQSAEALSTRLWHCPILVLPLVDEENAVIYSCFE